MNGGLLDPQLLQELERIRREEEIREMLARQNMMGAQQQPQGINPMQMASVAQNFIPSSGGGLLGSSAAPSAGATSSGGSMLASVGPWALLAAAIVGNETEARRGGYRAEDDTEYARDLLTGRVVSQDIDQRWGPKLFGSAWEENKGGIPADILALTDAGAMDFSGAWDHLKEGSLAKLFGGLF